MDLPHGRIFERHAFQQHILAAIRLDELRTQVMPFAENSLADRRALFGHGKESCAIGELVRLAFFPSAPGAAFPRPPVLAVGITVDDSLARDRNILFFK